jgi:hypothetical protein
MATYRRYLDTPDKVLEILKCGICPMYLDTSGVESWLSKTGLSYLRGDGCSESDVLLWSGADLARGARYYIEVEEG